MGATKKLNIRKTLVLASCSLIGNTAPATEVDVNKSWAFDIALLTYSESDGRATALAPLLKAQRILRTDESVTMTVGFDTVSGASPVGAIPSALPQTLSRPSGGQFNVAKGEIPMDIFHDKRYQLGLTWEKSISRESKSSSSFAYSEEFDYITYTANTLISRDINKRNTTVSVGIAYEADHITPGFGIPVAFADVSADNTQKEKVETRKQTDLLLGLTQVISRQTIMQLNYSLSVSDGYHTDHTKIISIIDDQAGSNLGNPLRALFEKRPDSRKMQSLFMKVKHHLSRDILDLSYRYFRDDWEIVSHTLDYRYTFTSKKDTGEYWQPHLRFYQQQAANFYHTHLLASNALPQYASADFRISDMKSYTLGIKYSQPVEKDNRISIRLEYIQQTAAPSPGSYVGVLNQLQIVPDTKASIMQLQYSF